MKQTRKVLALVTVIVIAAVAVVVPARLAPLLRDAGLLGSRSSQGSDEPHSAQTSSPNVSAQRVQTELAYRETLTNSVRLPAELRAATRVEVFPETSGTLIDLPLQVGSRVQVGEVIGHVDPSRPGTHFERSPVRAPIAGTLTALHADPGTRVTPATPVFRIETLHELELRVEVPERYLAYLHSRTRAELHLPSLSAARIPVQVKRMSPVIEAHSRAKEVFFRLMPSAEGHHARELQPGMFGELFLATQHRPDVVTVPRSAVIEREAGTTVLVVKGGTVTERPVELGITVGGRTEIVTGIEPQDEVVIGGQAGLRDGDQVEPVQRSSGAQASGS